MGLGGRGLWGVGLNLFGKLFPNMSKIDFLGHCSFTQCFHDVEKLRRKPNIFVKVIQRFWCVQAATLVKVFNVGKPMQDF